MSIWNGLPFRLPVIRSRSSGVVMALSTIKSRVFGAGPILTYTMGAGTATPLTFIAKYYKEFDAKNTFEGEVWDVAFSFKF